MKLKQRIKQFFCCHAYNNNTPKYTTPFLGWMFQCPKCNGYVAYFKEWDEFVDISERKFEFLKEEGKKLHGFLEYKENKNDRS
jgi:transcription initiation factor IIE alpha subunit